MATQLCWQVWQDRGLLINPDPLVTPTNVPEIIVEVAERVPELMEAGTLHAELEQLPLFDFSAALESDPDFRVTERLMQIYSYFASSYVYADHEQPMNRIPAPIAVPLVKLAHLVERPPILSYSGYVLNNWKRIDPHGPIALSNLETIQHFRGGRDEDWFILVHVDIEARAAGALTGIQEAAQAALNGDAAMLESALTCVHTSIAQMIETFHRMPEGCASDVYYWKVRPYIFSFTDIVYEGVSEYNGKPQSFRGQTGAQSSIIPVMVAGLGLHHEQSGLTHHLEIMKDYMPKPHRELIAAMKASTVRQAVIQHGGTGLREAYNECLRRVLEFRRLHYHYATEYIAKKVTNPLGTGGTIFMDWLAQLANETEAQMV